MERDSFVFYRSFYDSIKELSGKEKALVYDAIFEYALNNNLQALPQEIKLKIDATRNIT